MNNKNQRVFKFARKEYQTSEEINPKKPEEKKQRPLPKQEQKLRKHINYFAQDEPEEKEQKKSKNQEEIQIQHSIGDQKVAFDKKLTKIRINVMKKIQNRLLGCLERRKPHVPVKQLISQEILIEIMGTKERKLITNNPIGQKLNYEAQSVRKSHNIQSKSKDVIEQIQLKVERQSIKQTPESFGFFDMKIPSDEEDTFESNFQQFNLFAQDSFQSQFSFPKIEERPERKLANRNNNYGLPNNKIFQDSSSQDLFFKDTGNYSSKDVSSLDTFQQFQYQGEINLKNLKIPKLIPNQRPLQFSPIKEQEFSFVKSKPKGIFQPPTIFKAVDKEQDRKKIRKNQNDN